MVDINSIINLVIYCVIYVAGLIAINKIPFFKTNLNPQKNKGKKFITLGWTAYFISNFVSTLLIIFVNMCGIGALIPLVNIFGFVRYLGMAGLIYGAVLSFKGSKSEKTDEEKGEQAKENVKKPAFTANEEMSQRAQYAYINFRNEYEQGATAIDDVAEAKMFAKAVQLQLLKTPASAVFCSMEEMSVLPIGDGAYSVSGYVDSQNSYGAMLRNQFNLTVFKDENGIWKNANRFVSTAASINSNIISTSILWWILGIIGTIITLAVSYAFTSSMF